MDGLDAEATLRRLEAEHGALPATVEVITARGRHVYFKWPQEPVRNSAGKIGTRISMSRGDGGYVLCPPSIHPSGRRYSWSVDSADRIAEAPGWLLAKQKGVAIAGTTPSSEWRALIEGVSEGARDCSLQGSPAICCAITSIPLSRSACCSPGTPPTARRRCPPRTSSGS